MKKAGIALVACCLSTPAWGNEASPSLVHYANPLQGTDSWFDFSYGNTYPAIALPFPMNVWTPYTHPATSFFYRYSAKTLSGFMQTHQPSPHMGDYGAFAFMPITGKVAFSEAERTSTFKHDNEVARPSYYRVQLDTWNVVTEITPTERAASFRVTFKDKGPSHIVLDGLRGETTFEVIAAENKIVGKVTNNNGGVPSNFANYFVIVFDQPFSDYKLWSTGDFVASGAKVSGKPAGVVLSFNTSQNNVVTFRASSSFIDRAQAELNLAQEIGQASFDETLKLADERWNKTLGLVAIEGASEEQRRTFYSALYRSVLFPQKFHERNAQGKPRYYSPYDGKVHAGVMYTNSGFWDTFRAVHPLFNLLFPKVSAEILQGLLDAYDQSGFLPSWSSPGHRPIMIGNHAFSLLADGLVKGVGGFDAKKALSAVSHDAHTEAPKKMRTTGRQGAGFYDSLGYVPTPNVGEGVSKTLEYAYDDFCAAQIARHVGDRKAEASFTKAAQNYRNVFDAKTGFMRGRLQDGKWFEPFDPFDWGGRYTEGNAWHWNWSVFHDVQGLVGLLGGDQQFADRLDELFSSPPIVKVGAYGRLIHEMAEMIAINMGQYAHANQPVQHATYLYNYVGQPWKAQQRVRETMTKLYNSSPRGLCGDEDTGQTSAWYIFSALGFYPVTPGHPSYVLGSPLFSKATLYLQNKKRFVISAPANAFDKVFIDGAALNGKPFNRTFLLHKEIVAGGQLDLNMSPLPNKSWATDKNARPFSTTRTAP